LKANNKISYGKRFTIFSALDGQPCADHDRAKGEGVAAQEYTCIKIALVDIPEQFAEWKEEKIFLVAATLRPETMYGQTNCFVLPEGEYGLFEMKTGEFFVMTERAAKNMAYQEMTKEDTKFPCLAKITG
jgi:leucyl-tRNA synthetase